MVCLYKTSVKNKIEDEIYITNVCFLFFFILETRGTCTLSRTESIRHSILIMAMKVESQKYVIKH